MRRTPLTTTPRRQPRACGLKKPRDEVLNRNPDLLLERALWGGGKCAWYPLQSGLVLYSRTILHGCRVTLSLSKKISPVSTSSLQPTVTSLCPAAYLPTPAFASRCYSNRSISPVRRAHSSERAAVALLLWAHAGTDRRTDIVPFLYIY